MAAVRKQTRIYNAHVKQPTAVPNTFVKQFSPIDLAEAQFSHFPTNRRFSGLLIAPELAITTMGALAQQRNLYHFILSAFVPQGAQTNLNFAGKLQRPSVVNFSTHWGEQIVPGLLIDPKIV